MAKSKDNAKSKGGNICEIVREIAQPIAQQCGVEIWDVRYVKEGAQWYLRVFIDKEEGISINDCEAVSRALDEPLEKNDPVKDAYILEVSSPGVERELTRPEHFERFMGADIMVRLIRPMEVLGRDFCGVLTDFDKDSFTVTDHDGENTVTVSKKDVAWVKLDDFD